jgi:hypothetical protein
MMLIKRTDRYRRSPSRTSTIFVSTFSAQRSGLEDRQLMAATAVNLLTLRSFAPVSGGALNVDYEISQDLAQSPGLTFQFFRSEDSTLDGADKSIGESTVSATEMLKVGPHRLTVDLGEAMRPDPSRPFVIVIGHVNGSVIETVLTDNSASFRKYTVAAVSHGGIQGSSYNIPTWQAKIGHRLQSYGYDSVIAFNWANQSRTPGAAADQAPRLGRRILQEIAQLPAGASVDIDYLAHSQGTVVVSQAALWMEKHADPSADTGYKRMTLLDPHAANPQAPNNAESITGGWLGRFVKTAISWYKGNARDPLVRVPKSMHEADVYYQRTPLSVNPVNDGLYNLLGQVPVIGTARYVQLNSPGISHSGGGGVYSWFYFNALPAYATGEKPGNPSVLETTSVRVAEGGWSGIHLKTTDARPVWNGVAAPFATVKLYLAPSDAFVEESRPLATTTADASGHWELSPGRNIPGGAYQVNIRAFLPAGLPRENRQLMPTIRMGTVIIRKSPNGPLSSAASDSLPDAKISLSIPNRLNKNGIGLRLNDSRQTFDPKNRIAP